MSIRSITRAFVAMTLVIGAAACASGVPADAGDADWHDYRTLSGTLNGSGATFPKTFYEDAIAGFSEVATHVTVNYNAVGSGQGKKDLAAGTTDWAGSDSTVSEADKSSFKGTFLYFPTVASPITVSYNLSSVKTLKLSPSTLTKIFMGTITNWDDSAIASDNPGVELPDRRITVAVRSDGSGTTSNFSKYLAAAAPSDFTVTAGDTVTWPSAQAGKGNAGVAQIIKDTPGAIGYVDFSDALATKLRTASIRNRDGNYIAPSVGGATAALANATVKDDLTYSALDAPGPEAYPITAGTYVLVYQSIAGVTKAEAIKGWLDFLLTDGQQIAPLSDFAPLPSSLRDRARAQIERITAS